MHSRNKIMGRVKDLADLLGAPKHPDFRSFRCKAIALDSETARIAFIFEMPAYFEIGPPKPLRTMYGSSLSVTERLQLALRITESVRYSHMADGCTRTCDQRTSYSLQTEAYLQGILLLSPYWLAFLFHAWTHPQ